MSESESPNSAAIRQEIIKTNPDSAEVDQRRNQGPVIPGSLFLLARVNWITVFLVKGSLP